jgi:hypothetical protein
MKIRQSKFATRALDVASRIGVAAVVITALFGGVQAFWFMISHHQMLAAAELQKIGATVLWACRFDDRMMAKESQQLVAPSWLVPGDGYVAGVYLSNLRQKDVDEKLISLESCRGIRDLLLNNLPISDAALLHVAHLTNLESLDLRNTEITDAGLRSLAALKHLKHLNLCGTRVTATGLATLQAQLPTADITADVQAT